MGMQDVQSKLSFNCVSRLIEITLLYRVGAYVRVVFLTLPNNLFFAQIIKQSINYVLFSITHDWLPTFGQVFYPTLEEIRRFDREELVEPILEFSVVVEGNSVQIVGERERKRW
jgi:hypothetical protein